MVSTKMLYFCHMLSRFILIFICLVSISLYAGNQEEQDTSKQKIDWFPKSYGQKEWKFLLGFDASRSFLQSRPVKINGLRIGLKYRGVHRFGLGIYGLSRDLVFTDLPVDAPDATDTSRVIFGLSYASVFYERVFFRNPKWEFSLPFLISGGSLTGRYEDTAGVFRQNIDQAFSALSGGIQAKYYFWPWLAGRVSTGYRFLFNTSPELKTAFNAPYYGFGVQILVGELYRTIFRKEDSDE
jgi:hypothetical protein